MTLLRGSCGFVLTPREVPSRVGSVVRGIRVRPSMVIIDLPPAGAVSTGFGPEAKTSQAVGANNPYGSLICYEKPRRRFGGGRRCPHR